MRGRGFGEVLWVFGIVAFLAYYKIPFTYYAEIISIDGGFYTNVAQFVKYGLGLKTNLSLYHQGYSYFPHETSVSPLWPLLYGFIGRYFDLLAVGNWLPTLLYFASLISAYFWGASLSDESLFVELPSFNAGHLLMLMLGLHHEFYYFTSAPYTEGLAYTLALICLCRFGTRSNSPNLLGGLEIGVWITLVFFTRAQLVIILIAMVLGLTVKALLERSREQIPFMIALLSVPTLAAASYYGFFLSEFVGSGPWEALMRFDQGWETNYLSPFQPMVATEGPIDYIVNRASGFAVAFTFQGPFAYSRSFQLYAYSIFPCIAMIYSNIRTGTLDLPSFTKSKWFVPLLLGVGGWLSIHLIHKDYHSEWHFARRQGLTAIFLFFLCNLALLRSKRIYKAIGVFILVGSICLGWQSTLQSSLDHARSNGPYRLSESKLDVAQWLAKNAEGNDSLVVALPSHLPQEIGYTIPNIGIHWFFDRTSTEDFKVFVEKFGVSYLLLDQRHSSHAMKADFQDYFELKEMVGDYAVFVVRRSESNQ